METIILDLLLICAAALIGGVCAKFLHLPLIIGYVIAGIAIGPYTSFGYDQQKAGWLHFYYLQSVSFPLFLAIWGDKVECSMRYNIHLLLALPS